jgi:8-oxo-dGTP pyrophosphatase MutT (NUDIX family)
MLVSKNLLSKLNAILKESKYDHSTSAEFQDLKHIKDAGTLLMPNDLYLKEMNMLLDQYQNSQDIEMHLDDIQNIKNFLEFFLDPTPEKFAIYTSMSLSEIESDSSTKNKMEAMIKEFTQSVGSDFLGAVPSIITFKNNIFNKDMSKELFSKDLKQTSQGEPTLHDLFLDLYMIVISSQYYSKNFYTTGTKEKPFIIKILEDYRGNIEKRGANVRIATNKFVKDLTDYAINFSYSNDPNYIEEIAQITAETKNSTNETYVEMIEKIISAFSVDPNKLPEVATILKSMPDFEVFKQTIDLKNIDLQTTRKEVERYFPKRGRDKKRWGVQGAGILLISKPDAKTKTFRELLLQKRADWVTGGAGKWAFPGGAFNPLSLDEEDKQQARSVIEDELGIKPMESIKYEKHYQADNTPLKLNTRNVEHLRMLLASAMVEFKEEVGISLKNIGPIEVKKAVVSKTYDWHYVTFIIEVDVNQKALIQSNIKEDSEYSESEATRWVPIEDILFKEGVGQDLWSIAFNNKVNEAIEQYGKKIRNLYTQYNVQESDIPSNESLEKIIGFLNFMTLNQQVSEQDLYQKVLKENIDIEDLIKVMLTIAIHTKAKEGVLAMRNIESLETIKTFGQVSSLYRGRPLNFLMLLSKQYPDIMSKEVNARDALIGNRIIRKISSIKDNKNSVKKVYRAVSDIPSKEIYYSLMYPGSEYFLGNNVSTSIEEFNAYDFMINPSIMYTIEIKDKSGVAASAFSYFRDEKEILISGSIRVKSFSLSYTNLLIGGKKVTGRITSKDGLDLVQKLIYYCYENKMQGRLECYVSCELIS